jgi:hypothetical protein
MPLVTLGKLLANGKWKTITGCVGGFANREALVHNSPNTSGSAKATVAPAGCRVAC